MFKVMIALIMLFSSISFACKLGSGSQWSLSEERLAEATKTIVIARLEEILAGSDSDHSKLKFRILKVKKGKYKESFLEMKDVRKTDTDGLAYGKNCGLEFKYVMGQEYLIYVDTLNPRSIYPIKFIEK